MKLPERVRSYIDELDGLSPSDKSKVLRHLTDIKDSLDDHPSPKEAQRIVQGALKHLEIKLDKKEVKESKLTFKAFLENTLG